MDAGSVPDNPVGMAVGPVRWGALLACGALLCACGGSGHSSTTPAVHLPKNAQKATGAPAVADLPGAEHPSISEFPPAAGRSLKQLALLVKQTAQLGPGTGTYARGRQRFAFALTDHANRFIYAPTAVY